MLTWVGFAAFFVASSSVGIRLIALWRRNGGIPELLIGVGVLGIGPVGFGSITVGQLLWVDHDTVGRVVFAVGMFAASVGALSKFVFNTYVYHPNSRFVWGIAATAAVALLLCFVWNGLANGYRNISEMDSFYLVRTGLTVACLLWGSAEALRYWGMMRRRVRIGLGEPVVTNRFLLWGVGAGAAGLGTLVGVIAQWWTSLPPIEIPWVMLNSSIHGMVAAVAMWLAFLPPARYQRYVLDRSRSEPLA